MNWFHNGLLHTYTCVRRDVTYEAISQCVRYILFFPPRLCFITGFIRYKIITVHDSIEFLNFFLRLLSLRTYAIFLLIVFVSKLSFVCVSSVDIKLSCVIIIFCINCGRIFTFVMGQSGKCFFPHYRVIFVYSINLSRKLKNNCLWIWNGDQTQYRPNNLADHLLCFTTAFAKVFKFICISLIFTQDVPQNGRERGHFVFITRVCQERIMVLC